MKKAFEETTSLITASSSMVYPNQNKLFNFYTDDSDYQMGACIEEDVCPFMYLFCMLTGAQKINQL